MCGGGNSLRSPSLSLPEPCPHSEPLPGSSATLHPVPTSQTQALISVSKQSLLPLCRTSGCQLPRILSSPETAFHVCSASLQFPPPRGTARVFCGEVFLPCLWIFSSSLLRLLYPLLNLSPSSSLGCGWTSLAISSSSQWPQILMSPWSQPVYPAMPPHSSASTGHT